MPLPGSLAQINKAAIAAAKNGDHANALRLYDELFAQAAKQHLTHPELFVTYANRAASHLAVGQHAEALQDAQQCVSLLKAAASAAGLFPCNRHPYWPKACQRLGDALLGLGQYQQAIPVYEAGLSADPLNPNLKSGLQQAQHALVQDLLAGKTLSHLALPAPPTPQRITHAPHNPLGSVLKALTCGGKGGSSNPGDDRFQASSNLGPGRQYVTGWESPAEIVARAAEAGQLSLAQSDGSKAVSNMLTGSGGVGGGTSWTLPRVLLTPETAAADTAMTDVYEYITTQCNVQLPKRYLHRQLPDSPRLTAWWRATSAAVQAVLQSGRTCRVLLLGAKAGLLAVAAVRAGATHVTCVETCPYLAAACNEVLLVNGLSPSSFHVAVKHPTALKLGTDLPMVCNLLIADVIDDGVLSGGFVPAVAHALDELLVRDDPVVVPAAVTVMVQAVGVRASRCWAGDGARSSEGSKQEAGKWLDLSALDQYRWTPSQALPSPFDPSTFKPLSDPLAVWHMPALAITADVSGVRVLDVELQKDGRWCGMLFWAELQLFKDVTHTTSGPWMTSSGSSAFSQQYPPSQQPAICWFEGEVPVIAGEIYPLVATHNTVRLSFTLKEADYSRLFIKDPTFPHGQFAMAADQPRISAYFKALTAAIARVAADKQQQQQQQQEGLVAEQQQGMIDNTEVTVLDVGCGSGVLSLLATDAAEALSVTNTAAAIPDPTAGTEHAEHLPTSSPTQGLVAASVTAADFVAPVSAAALRNVAANGCSGSVSVVHGDGAMLQRGVHVPMRGVDVLVLDVFDAGLIGHQVLPLIETVKAKLLADGGQVVPTSATLYMMGVEIHSGLQAGGSSPAMDGDRAQGHESMSLDLSALERFRWSGEAESVILNHLPHKQLTRPVKLFDFDFCQPVGTPYPTEAAVELDMIAAGRMNAVVVWFDLHLAEGVCCISAPDGFTTGGRSSVPPSSNSKSNTAYCDSISSPHTRVGQESAGVVVVTAAPSSDADPDCRAIILHPQSDELILQQWQQQQREKPTLMYEQQQQQQADEQAHHQPALYNCHHWGQSLQYLDDIASVETGDTLQMLVKREGCKLLWHCLGGRRQQQTTSAPMVPTEAASGIAAGYEARNGSTDVADMSVPLFSAARSPWLRPGAGIEDPAVWSVKKCQQLLGQMLQRAPGGKFPPIYKDMEIMQVHAGSLGLDAATVGVVTQELTMQEALAVAAQRQLAVSLASSADAAGLKPPVIWK